MSPRDTPIPVTVRVMLLCAGFVLAAWWECALATWAWVMNGGRDD